MSSDYDREQWQAEQVARDAAIEKQRDKERKARERAARNAKRKLERLQRTLSQEGEISDFETEFAESVTERLDQFGSAFNDLEKGRPGDALSFAQKRVVAGMNRKAKDLRKRPKTDGDEGADNLQRPKWDAQKPRSSLKSKKPKFQPRVRQLDETFDDDVISSQPYLPERAPEVSRPPVGKPFLRIVKTED